MATGTLPSGGRQETELLPGVITYSAAIGAVRRHRAIGASCTSEGNSIVQVAMQASRWVERHVRPTLALALVAQQLMGLLARPLSIVFERGTSQAFAEELSGKRQTKATPEVRMGY
jgi:Na+/glutamate symporter